MTLKVWDDCRGFNECPTNSPTIFRNAQRSVERDHNGQDDIASVRGGPLEDAEEYLVCATKGPDSQIGPLPSSSLQTGETTKKERCHDPFASTGTKHQQGDFTSGVLGFFTLLSRDKYMQPTYYQVAPPYNLLTFDPSVLTKPLACHRNHYRKLPVNLCSGCTEHKTAYHARLRIFDGRMWATGMSIVHGGAVSD